MFRLHAFDGSCALSKDGDVDLLFDDGSKLIAQKSRLSLVSAPLHKEIGKQTGSRCSLKIKGAPTHIWKLLLNLIHCDDESYKENYELGEVIQCQQTEY